MFGNRSNALIITFIGPVGVGKSTQMYMMKRFLEKRRIRVVTTFIKSSHGLSHILGVFLSVVGIHRIVPGQNTLIDSQKSVVRKLLPLWRLLDTVSIASKFFFTVFLPYEFGFTVLMEEGPMMTLFTYHASFPLFFHAEPSVPDLIPSLVEYIMKSNHVNVLLTANDRELHLRRGLRTFRQVESSDYVALQKQWIKKMEKGESVLVDTSGESIVGVHNILVSVLLKRRLVSDYATA